MKKIYKALLLGSILCGGGYPLVANAVIQCLAVIPPPYPVTDRGRTIVGMVTAIMSLTGDGESKAQLIATQEQNNKNASGSSGSADQTDTSQGQISPGSAGASEFSGSAFDYVNQTLLSTGMGNVGYEPLKKVLSSADRQGIREAVKNNFFADPTKPEESTTEYKNKVKAERSAYVQEAATRHVTLGYRVKGHIQNDLTVISSVPVTGDGELGAIAVDAHTLEQMVKMELVDLALQIEMMEADAIQFLIQQPVELMRETKSDTRWACAVGVTYPPGSPCAELYKQESPTAENVD